MAELVEYTAHNPEKRSLDDFVERPEKLETPAVLIETLGT